MLTGDLVRVRRKGGAIVPRWVDAKDRARLLGPAHALVDAFAASVGKPREEVERALGAVDGGARDRVVIEGLKKLLDDRARWEISSPLDPETVRREVFVTAAAAQRAQGVRGELDRDAVIAEVAVRLGHPPVALEAALYADLRANEVLVGFDPIDAPALLAAYDLALAQAMLLRATQVEIAVRAEEPRALRRLFRALRFHGLLHVVRGAPDTGWLVTVDGPFSLFGPVQKYGLRLAMLLHAVLSLSDWRLRATVLWGPRREQGVLEIGPEQGLVADRFEGPDTAPELDAFATAFRALGSEWSVAPNDRVVALPGKEVVVPDLVFRRADGAEVVLEAFGFWSRAAVWRRVEQVRGGDLGVKMLLAIGKQLRVSEEVLADDEAGEIYVYKATMSPKAVLERLRRLVPL